MGELENGGVTQRKSLVFSAPGEVIVESESMPQPQAHELLITARLSAISPGTEMLFYRGQVPSGITVDATIEALGDHFSYPLKYGYAAVGEVTAVGDSVDPTWLGRRIFAFNPHESHFLARTDAVIEVPGALTLEQATLLPNMETAVNFLMDGQPMIGERVLVIGQGIVGLLTAALLSSYPLAELIVVDALEPRRQLGLNLGAQQALSVTELAQSAGIDADLVFEVSGNPAALDQAIRHSGFDGRVVVGSWYGSKQATLDLGSHFHRSRTRVISSQVSSIHPRFLGRWDKARRLETAWRMLAELDVDQLISHRFPLRDAAEAYRLIDKQPDKTVQVLLTYDNGPP